MKLYKWLQVKNKAKIIRLNKGAWSARECTQGIAIAGN